jgi:ABC-2 type transport system ATP-binding protein
MTSDLELTATENLMIFAKLYGVPRARRRELVADLLAAVELSKWANAPVKNLSGGMRRRVEIARGLVHEPAILFLDEPTTGLDPVSRTSVWEMIRSLKRGRDLTVLLTTHYMDEADRLCDRIAIVDHGTLMALDSPLRLKANIPGENTLEVSFGRAPTDWMSQLQALPGVEEVTGEGDVYRIASGSGPDTTTALMARAAERGVTVTSLSVKSTTLDDVFVHYTGHDLRDALHQPSAMERRQLMRPER